MVNVAIAGGSGQVAREIIDALLAAKKHNVTVLTRGETPASPISPFVHWKKVDYSSTTILTEALGGIHTLLSFVQILSDTDQMAQRNLIDAAIAAGVKRFAPSEYGSKDIANMAWWQGKVAIREYLQRINENGEVLEYTLFQPGLFLDYLAFPHKTSKHVDPLQSAFDFEHKRAILVNGHEDAVMTFTSVADVARIVALAVEYEGKWPTVGGIRGNRLTTSQLVQLGRKIRGEAFNVEKVHVSDLEAGHLKTSWGLEATHHAVSAADATALLKAVLIGTLLSSTEGAWDVSNEMNVLFPDYKFISIDDFLAKAWGSGL